MSTNETAPAAKADPVYEATLIRGKTYTLRGVRFERDKPVKVSEKVKAYLEENAYEEITNGLSGEDEETERKPKFKFSRVRQREA